MRRSHAKRPRRPNPPETVVRMTTGAQLVAALPVTLGYTPSESLVVVCCHEPRGRVGLTMRLDLPPQDQEEAAVDYVQHVVREQQATRLVLVVYTDEPDGELRARAVLMEQLLDAFPDLVITEALLVRGGRFWSYTCEREQCCPAAGRPVDEAERSAAVEVLKLEQARLGEAALATREDLEASIAPPTFLAEEEALQLHERAATVYADVVVGEGLPAARAQAMAAWRAALEATADPRWELPHDDAAALGATLHDKQVRDGVAALWQDGVPDHRRLLAAVARRTPAPYDAPVCTTLAWVTYCDGGGSLTSIALERALTSDPDYSMALLLRHALNHAFPPEFVRDITRRTREVLEDAA
jgi:hypothetical protein